MKNIIVVTGGAGFIGSNLIKYLLNKTDFKIISVDNYSTGSKKNHIKHKNVKFIPSRPGDRADSTFLNNNAKTILGFIVKKNIKTYIKEFINKY